MRQYYDWSVVPTNEPGVIELREDHISGVAYEEESSERDYLVEGIPVTRCETNILRRNLPNIHKVWWRQT
jgi:hypothetical protein